MNIHIIPHFSGGTSFGSFLPYQCQADHGDRLQKTLPAWTVKARLARVIHGTSLKSSINGGSNLWGKTRGFFLEPYVTLDIWCFFPALFLLTLTPKSGRRFGLGIPEFPVQVHARCRSTGRPWSHS